MRRMIDDRLASWKSSPARKPLVVNGARQVGKTYSVLEFGKQAFADVMHLDFVAQPALSGVFEGDITPRALVPQIEALFGKAIRPESTLLFFDEAQACPRALASLKYFCEQAPEYHVVSAGSLLGITIARKGATYPVGKVDRLDLHPLSFEEYLWATGRESLAGLIRQACASDQKLGLHDLALDAYRNYLIVGGMPEAVLRSIRATEGDSASVTLSFEAEEAARSVQRAIVDGYLADMLKHASPSDSARILSAWQSVPEQLAKENHKFQYSTISSSARAHQYEFAIKWLDAAGMVAPCVRVSEALHPLASFEERDFFKLYLADTGLLTMLQGVRRADLAPADDRLSRIRGGIAENFVMQQLVASGMAPRYWGVASKSEVEFVVENGAGEVVPIEVKSGQNVTSKSLSAFRKKYQPPYVARVSMKNFGFEGGVRSVPLYAAFCLAESL